MASTTTCFTRTELSEGNESQTNFPSRNQRQQEKDEKQTRLQSSPFLLDGGRGGNNDSHFQVSALSMQKYQNFIRSPFVCFNNKNDVVSGKKQNSTENMNGSPFSTRGNSSFIENINDITNNKNDYDNYDDDYSLSEKSTLSNIFDDEDELIVVSTTKKATFSSSSSSTVPATSFVGQEGNEVEEQDLDRRDGIADVLGSVATLLDSSTYDDFSQFTNNTSGRGNIYHQVGLLSNYMSSSTLPIEPTPISTEPGRIQVIQKISSLPDEQEGPSLFPNCCSPPTSSKIFCYEHDHDRDIRDHVIKVLLNHHHHPQSSSPRSNEEQKQQEDKKAPTAQDQTADAVSPFFCHGRSSSTFTSKKRSISSREWSDEDNHEDNDDSFWFTSNINDNITLDFSKVEHTVSKGDIFAQPPPPARKKSRTDDEPETSLFQSGYLEQEDNQYHGSTTTTQEQKNNHRFRSYQAEQWWQRFQDMVEFQKTYGHCNVPNIFPPNPILAQWVKRQRYQFKLKQEGKHSTLTDEREAILQNMSFIWDSHSALWEERWNELKEFHDKVGHSNVPTHYKKNRQLAIWVKCQRRQYKLYVAGDPKSNMTVDRIRKLALLDFVWHPKVGAKSAKEKEQYNNL